MKVLFLDIDGVLNGHEKHPDSPYTTIRPDCVQRLNRVLRETGCRIVLSSAWRYMLLKTGRERPPMTLLGFQYMLHTHGLVFAANGSAIIGHTQADEECCHCGHKHGHKRRQLLGVTDDGERFCAACKRVVTRGQQIARWCRIGLVEGDRYAVVDDDDLSIKAAGHPFVQTDGKLGLTDANARELIRLLR